MGMNANKHCNVQVYPETVVRGRTKRRKPQSPAEEKVAPRGDKTEEADYPRNRSN